MSDTTRSDPKRRSGQGPRRGPGHRAFSIGAAFRRGATAAVGLAGLLGLGTLALAEAGPRLTNVPAVDGNREPTELVFSPDGRRVYVSEAAEEAIAVIDAQAHTVVTHLPSGGQAPQGLAVTPDGARLVVANSFSGNVATVNLKGRPQPQLLTVRGMPFGVAVSPDGRRAYITASQLDEVAVLDLDAGRTIGMVRVGRRPRAVALTPDGKTLVAANLAGASLSIVDTQSLRESARVALRGTNVRGVAISADGTEAYAVAMPAFNNRPTADPREIWHNIVQGVFLSGETSSVGENQWMDFARLPGSSELIGSPDQHGIVVDRALRHAWVSVAGRDVVTRITIHDRLRDAAWPISQVETPVGASPRGLALSPDGREVWVANSLGNSVSVIDAGTMKLRVTIPLGAASRADPHLVGRYLFGSGALTRSQRFTCNSCHPDGGTDGLTWSFVHVTDRFGRRNSRDLRAGIAETAPFRWSGFDRELGGFIREEAIGLLQGPTPTAEQIGRLAAAVGVPRLPPSPFRQEDGSLTPAAERGRALFVGKAGCSSCHQGSMLGGTAMRAWIGTTREGQTVDVPHLVGAYDSAPYLHDGRADTLEAIFERHNPEQLHGNAHLLTKDELAQVLEYVRQQ